MFVGCGSVVAGCFSLTISYFALEEKIQGALADSRAQVAREFPFVVDRLFPEAGVAEPRMPLYWIGYSGLDGRRLYHYGDGCAQGIF